MRRQNTILVIAGLLVLGSLAFLGWAALQVTAPAAAPPQPTAVDPGNPPTAGVNAQQGVVATELFTMTLPAGWLYTQEAFAEQAPVDPLQAQSLVVAWQGGDTFEQSERRFNVVAMPRNGLTLEQYLVEAAERFTNTGGIGNVTTDLVTDLRSDGLPAALVGYSISLERGESVGHQAVMIASDDTQLLVATLSHPADGSDVEQLFRTLVGAMHLAETGAATSQVDIHAAATACSVYTGA